MSGSDAGLIFSLREFGRLAATPRVLPRLRSHKTGLPWRGRGTSEVKLLINREPFLVRSGALAPPGPSVRNEGMPSILRPAPAPRRRLRTLTPPPCRAAGVAFPLTTTTSVPSSSRVVSLSVERATIPRARDAVLPKAPSPVLGIFTRPLGWPGTGPRFQMNFRGSERRLVSGTPLTPQEERPFSVSVFSRACSTENLKLKTENY